MPQEEIQLEKLRSPELQTLISEGWTTVVFACGAVEQHGPHLPLFVDAEHGTALAVEIARRLGKALVAPTIRVGCSEHHMAFSGTLSLRAETFEMVVTDYVTSLARHGVRRLLIVPSHGGNFEPLRDMMDRLREAAGPDATVQAYTDLIGVIRSWRDVAEEVMARGNRVGGHADIAETSILLSLHPDLVRSELAAPGFQSELSAEVIDQMIRNGFDSVSPNGILGDARGASPHMGTLMIQRLAKQVVDFFQS